MKAKTYIFILLAVLLQTGICWSQNKSKRLFELQLRNEISVTPTRYGNFTMGRKIIQLPLNESFSSDMSTLSFRVNISLNNRWSLIPETGISAVFNNQYNLYDTAIRYMVLILPIQVQAGFEICPGGRYGHMLQGGFSYNKFLRRSFRHRETGGPSLLAGYQLQFPGKRWALHLGWQWMQTSIWYGITSPNQPEKLLYEYTYKRKRHLMQTGLSVFL